MASNTRMALMHKLELPDQIKLVEELIAEDDQATIRDYLDTLQEIEQEIERIK